MDPVSSDFQGGVAARIARFAAAPAIAWPARTLDYARLSLYDCLSVALAGAREPVADTVRRMVAREGGASEASAFGLRERIPARAAALLNGTAAHALDYDDTHFAFVGHPSVAVLPAALAVAGQQQATGAALLEAFACGVEAACAIGAWLGRAHYDAGFHQTATSGTFGATAACARLLGLDSTAAQHALGIAASRAAGLKCQFGTMGKPFHAGMAAANGVEAATLASLGFLARADALECAGGFAATHGGEHASAAPFSGPPDAFRFADIRYKFHACCHGTHPTLDALCALRDEHALTPAAIAAVTLRIHPQWAPVCCIEAPRSGLELKFSLASAAAMVLAGYDTAALESWSDTACGDPVLLDLKPRIAIETDAGVADTAADVVVETHAGQRLACRIDADAKPSFDELASRLQAKSASLLGAARARQLSDFVARLDTLDAAQWRAFVHEWMTQDAA